MTEGGLSKAAAARQFNTTPKTVAKWVKRFRAEGLDGLLDRSSKPRHCRAKQRLRQLAADVGPSPATDSRNLRRLGLDRIRDLEPAEPVRRYEREKPGEMIHISSNRPE